MREAGAGTGGALIVFIAIALSVRSTNVYEEQGECLISQVRTEFDKDLQRWGFMRRTIQSWQVTMHRRTRERDHRSLGAAFSTLPAPHIGTI